jgi:hypothetical protein
MVAYLSRSHRQACNRSHADRQQEYSLVGLQWYGLDLDRAAGSLGLSLQVIIMIKKRCNDRVPALLRGLA